MKPSNEDKIRINFGKMGMEFENYSDIKLLSSRCKIALINTLLFQQFSVTFIKYINTRRDAQHAHDSVRLIRKVAR